MDEFDHPGEATEFGLTIALTIFAGGLCMLVSFLAFSEAAQIGPAVGEIVSFDPRNGPRYWSQPGILAVVVSAGDQAEAHQQRSCRLMPSIMAAHGGSLVVEAKETTRPPSFRVHWSGRRTDIGPADCGRSADLTLRLVQLRALTIVAGGHGQGLF